MNKTVFILLFVISVIFIVLQINIANSESLTWDELQHFKVGNSALFNNDFTIDPLSGTLIPQLAAFPGFQYSRLIISLLSVLTSFAIFIFTRKWFGDVIALVASCLFLFEPAVFANSHYITLDIGFTLLFFITYWLLITFYQKQSFKNLLILGVSIGFLLAAKVTGISYLGITLIAFYFIFRKKITKNLSLKYLSLFIAAIIFSIWLIYRFQFGTLGGFNEGGDRRSNEIAKKLAIINPKLSQLFQKAMTIRLPLGDYLRIIKNSYIYNQSPKESFFLGEMRQNPGRFFPLLVIFKTPISLLIFFILGVASLKGTKKLTILLIPIIGILVYLFFSNVNLRLRYILPIYPFLTIISAAGFSYFVKKSSIFRIPLILLLVLFFVVLFKSLPHAISYSNEISNIYAKPYIVFSDSNIDWGQGLIALKKYADLHNIGSINLSYYGTSSPLDYGFYGYSYSNVCKQPCTIETVINKLGNQQKVITAISITNWQECGFYKQEKYQEKNILNTNGGSILIFN